MIKKLFDLPLDNLNKTIYVFEMGIMRAKEFLL